MTGIERNADIVHMATYAPLFAHVKGWQWRPDAIWFDNLRSFKSVSYYVQQLYAIYKGSNVLPITMNKKVVAGDADQNGLFASAVYDKDMNAYIVKVANTGNETQTLNLQFQGVKKNQPLQSAKQILLHSDDLDAENTLDEPEKIVPQESELSLNGNTLTVDLGAKSFAVYIVKK